MSGPRDQAKALALVQEGTHADCVSPETSSEMALHVGQVSAALQESQSQQRDI